MYLSLMPCMDGTEYAYIIKKKQIMVFKRNIKCLFFIEHLLKRFTGYPVETSVHEDWDPEGCNKKKCTNEMFLLS